MDIIQEDTVRQLWLRKKVAEIRVTPNTFVTPQARDYMREKQLRLVVEGAPKENRDIRPAREQAGGGFQTVDGDALAEKPEHMTHLYGNTLVPKTHPRIVLRGKLDSLQAEIICFQVQAQRAEAVRLVEALGELLTHCRELLICEVSGKPLPQATLLGLDAGALREQSQHPKRFFGAGHILPSDALGELGAGLNRLRCLAREVEVAAVDAFAPAGIVDRADIIQALNRLSSAFYILMLRHAGGEKWR